MDTDPTESIELMPVGEQEEQRNTVETSPGAAKSQRSQRPRRSTAANYNYTNRYAFLDNDQESTE